MTKLFQWITVLFFLFIIWIIYAADTGRENIFFDIVHMMPYGDKFGHFFLFGILTLILNIALNFKRLDLWKSLPLGTFLISVFVIIEELSQGLIPNRTLDITDLIADALGIFIFTYVGYLIHANRVLDRGKSDMS